MKLANLRARAGLLARVRAFFEARGVLEVETPVLGRGGVSDPHLEPFATDLAFEGGRRERLFLQTSPEVFMKRLLVEGSGPIFQVGHAFRNGEVGSRHNHEFTILEWYRPGWDAARLRTEVGELLTELCRTPAPEAIGYRELFLEHTGIDPLDVDPAALPACCEALGVDVPPGLPPEDTDAWLDLLMGIRIEPSLGLERPVFVTGYPVHRAALALPSREDPRLAARFELYYRGLELANGFEELTDAAEQARRFEAVNRERRHLGQEPLPPDARFLEALARGMPATAGVAVGLDRVFMLALGADHIDEVLTFPYGML